MIDKLPCELTAGVTATREGLEVCADMALHFGLLDRANTEWLISWPDAAARLRYRDGEPWCYGEPDLLKTIFCLNYHPEGDYPRLHRLATILCNDADAWRVLYWCVTNLGGNNEV